MKRFITAGFSVLLLATLVAPAAKADDASELLPLAEPTQAIERPVETAPNAQARQDAPRPQLTEVRLTNPEKSQLSERDRLILERRLFKIIPADRVEFLSTAR